MKKDPQNMLLTSRRRAPSSVSLVVASLLLALIAVMAMPIVTYWAGISEGSQVDFEAH